MSLRQKWNNDWKWKLREQKVNSIFAAIVLVPASLAGWGAYKAGENFAEARTAKDTITVPVSEGRLQIVDNNLAGSRQDLQAYLQREIHSFKP